VELVDPSAYLATCQHFLEEQEVLVSSKKCWSLTVSHAT
jgi:hypothetical protein